MHNPLSTAHFPYAVWRSIPQSTVAIFGERRNVCRSQFVRSIRKHDAAVSKYLDTAGGCDNYRTIGGGEYSLDTSALRNVLENAVAIHYQTGRAGNPNITVTVLGNVTDAAIRDCFTRAERGKLVVFSPNQTARRADPKRVF